MSARGESRYPVARQTERYRDDCDSHCWKPRQV